MRYSQNRPAKQYAPQTQINHNNRLRQSKDWTPLIHSLLLRFDQERIVKGELHIKQPLKAEERSICSVRTQNGLMLRTISFSQDKSLVRGSCCCCAWSRMFCIFITQKVLVIANVSCFKHVWMMEYLTQCCQLQRLKESKKNIYFSVIASLWQH